MSDNMECPLCEMGEGELIEEEYADETYDDEADATNWQKYGPCSYCGAVWIAGTKFISFVDVVETGDANKHVNSWSPIAKFQTVKECIDHAHSLGLTDEEAESTTNTRHYIWNVETPESMKKMGYPDSFIDGKCHLFVEWKRAKEKGWRENEGTL